MNKEKIYLVQLEGMNSEKTKVISNAFKQLTGEDFKMSENSFVFNLKLFQEFLDIINIAKEKKITVEECDVFHNLSTDHDKIDELSDYLFETFDISLFIYELYSK